MPVLNRSAARIAATVDEVLTIAGRRVVRKALACVLLTLLIGFHRDYHWRSIGDFVDRIVISQNYGGESEIHIAESIAILNEIPKNID
ncbi:hypothetical protein CDD81_7536 [Ophiocordyceps australis]|uniref:Uncharacterized protein n=1 Tax=Ophiocordyceps australis TaxID=1399860 RepID=A0A2C5XXX3_9HYPO|nr:hypothetical protein CDD81_7536 [Ophiocordyceps australis]